MRKNGNDSGRGGKREWGKVCRKWKSDAAARYAKPAPLSKIRYAGGAKQVMKMENGISAKPNARLNSAASENAMLPARIAPCMNHAR